MISHHLNHCLRYSDSVDEYFAVERREDIMYEKIEKEITEWEFDASYGFLFSERMRLRAMDWFY